MLGGGTTEAADTIILSISEITYDSIIEPPIIFPAQASRIIISPTTMRRFEWQQASGRIVEADSALFTSCRRSHSHVVSRVGQCAYVIDGIRPREPLRFGRRACRGRLSLERAVHSRRYHRRRP